MADIERRYFVDTNGRDKVEYSLIVDDASIDLTSTFEPFSLEYLSISEVDDRRISTARAVNAARAASGGKPVKVPERTPWNPQRDFEWDAAPVQSPAGVPAASSPEAPRRWRLRAWGEPRLYLGTVKAVFAWADTVQGQKSQEGVFSAGNPVNETQTLELSDAAPELSRILVTAAPPPIAIEAPASIEDRAADVLRIVEARLQRGLGEAWLAAGAPSKGGVSYLDIPLAELTTPEELEECWAQHISQMLVGSNYVGPGALYCNGDGLAGDPVMFRKAADLNDPAYPPVFCCQQLATMACISRGFDDAANTPLGGTSAGPIANYQRGAQSPGRIEATLSPAGDNRSASVALRNGLLVPGLCYVVENFSHIAFVVRALKSGRLQMIDTGAMQGLPGHSSPFTPNSGFNYDTSPQTNITRQIKHLGVPPRAGALRSAIERMRRSRPLVLGRLVLLRRDTTHRVPMHERLLYATPLVPLWNRSVPTENYHIPLLVWSLRDLPYRDEIEARWLVDAPYKNPLREAVMSSRNFGFESGYNLFDPLTIRRICLADITSTASGGVLWVGKLTQDTNGAVWWRHEDGTTTNAWGLPRRDAYLENLPIGRVFPRPRIDVPPPSPPPVKRVLPSPGEADKKPPEPGLKIETGCPNLIELSATQIPAMFRLELETTP